MVLKGKLNNWRDNAALGRKPPKLGRYRAAKILAHSFHKVEKSVAFLYPCDTLVAIQTSVIGNIRS
jgi:hypothetical protein